MRMNFDPESDALYIRLSEADVEESEEVQPGIVLDFDASGSVVGVEVLNVSKRDHAPPIKQAA